MVFPHLQSLSCEQSGIGLSVGELAKKYKKSETLDLSHMEEEWNSKEGKWDPDEYKGVMAEIESWLRGTGDPPLQKGSRREILIVTHSSWIHTFTSNLGNPNLS